MHIRLTAFAESLRRHSLKVVQSCVRNCECLCAYKLHRAQQVYHRLWRPPRSKTLLRALRTRTIVFGATTLALFNWETERIPVSTLQKHYRDVEQAKQLIADTLTCRHCGQRLIVDIPSPGVKYCSCGSALASRGTPGNWVPFIERRDLLVWRRERAHQPGLFEYKLYGAYPEIAAGVFFQVQIDPVYRLEWDRSAVKVEVVDFDPLTQSQVLYWEMKWPKLFSNRDYVFNRRYLIDEKDKVIVVRSQVVDHPKLPEFKNKYRVKEYYCTMVIKPFRRFDEPGVEFCMTYFDNPGLSLPTPVQTWVATSAMPDFLIRLRNAAATYISKCKLQQECKDKPPIMQHFNETVSVS